MGEEQTHTPPADAAAALPSPPFYTHILNISNLRLASHGLTTLSGATLRPGILFRSATVSKLDGEGWKAVKELGVTHVFDLRSWPEVYGKDEERVKNADGVVDKELAWLKAMKEAGIKRSWTPVFADKDYSPERLAQRYSKYISEDVNGFVEAYGEFLASGGMAFGTVLKHLAKQSSSSSSEKVGSSGSGDAEKQGGILVHCTAGKDRTGMFYGLLFSFLGVPREQIADEYCLTQLGLAGVREEVVQRLLRSPAFVEYMAAQASGSLLSAEDVAKHLGGVDADTGHANAAGEEKVVPPAILDKGRQAALRMVSARKESMLGALEMLDDKFGGAERYMREVCGLGDEELEGLRRNLLVGGAR